ncbi:hypothetical protein OOK36_55075 [Streptomyces sp. NBC_00365]|uniref:hypothetical protein n=1 Tax=Streptomyces sp. NBC_00365 TaxID=2975726 RepID=UPI0022531EE0|nr:hypothetical protein [Streptomyces sp. NBC_00365]MCX5097580.1 hypothetical protein [Streptomyces sp. NBC_00365]
MNTIKGFLDGHSGRLADLLFALLAVYFGWWLSERARARADRDNGKAELNRQADALVVAVFDLRASAHTGYILWDRIVEHGRTILLASMAGVCGRWCRYPDRVGYLATGAVATEAV